VDHGIFRIRVATFHDLNGRTHIRTDAGTDETKDQKREIKDPPRHAKNRRSEGKLTTFSEIVLGFRRWLKRTNTNHTKGTKMEKNQISEMLAPFALSAVTAKSAANRIASALEKEGSPAQLLSSVSLSMKGLRGKVDAESSDYGSVYALESAFAFASAIAKKGTDKATKRTREVWADSQEEAIALKNAQASVKPAKPKKLHNAPAKEIDLAEVIEALKALTGYTGR
jgi:hypothetical protein